MGSQEALGASAGRTDESSLARRKLSPGPGLARQQVASHQLARIHQATIMIVAEQGYRALKVRDIVGQAEVSTRAFYEHFGSKEDCFLRTYELISRRASRRIIAAQAGERDWRKRSRLVFEEFVRGLEARPHDAYMALIEASAAGDASLERVWQAERVFEAMLAECFARAPRGVVVPPMVIEGMVAGIAGVSRRRLLAGEVSDLWASSEDLLDWALSYPDEIAGELASLDRQSVWRDTTLEPLLMGSVAADGESWPVRGDRALMLAAVAELAAANGYSHLTAARVRSAAGVSRRKFETSFDDLDDCYLAAVELRVGEALAQAARAQAAASSWLGGVYRAIAALCDHVAGDAFLTRVCLTNDFPPGQDGVRARHRLILAITELLGDGTPRTHLSLPLSTEASTVAIWSLFHHHIIRDWSMRRQIAATLSYLALAPAVGASAAVVAIRSEQNNG